MKRTSSASCFGLLASLALASTCSFAGEPTLAERVCASYDHISSVSALARKNVETQGHTGIMLSRVYYRKPDRLHVENIAPIRRRIISDGNSFFMAQDGWKKGYSVPLADLSGEWRILQKSIPGTAMEHLLRLKGVPEIELDGSADHLVRRAYQAEHVFVVLSADGQGRIARIEFFKDSGMASRIALYQFDNFVHVTNDCWLAARHQAEVNIEGGIVRETRRFDNLQVNQPIADGLFEPGAFFKDVEFVSDFSKLEEE